jgi:hypothetical protein
LSEFLFSSLFNTAKLSHAPTTAIAAIRQAGQYSHREQAQLLNDFSVDTDISGLEGKSNADPLPSDESDIF